MGIKLARTRSAYKLTNFASTVTAGLGPYIILSVRGAWQMNEPSGTSVADSTSNARNSSSLVGTAITTGKYGNGRSFNGSAAIVLPSSPLPSNANDPFSVSLWIYPTTLPGNGSGQTIARLGHTSGQWIGNIYQTGGITYLYSCFRNNAQFGFLTGGGINLNAWNHFVYTFNGGSKGSAGTYGSYLNGVALSQSGSFGTAGGSATDSAIGTDGGNVNGAIGTMDDVMVFDGVLTAEQVTKLNAASLVTINSGNNSALVSP